jgi:hypothetical protein
MAENLLSDARVRSSSFAEVSAERPAIGPSATFAPLTQELPRRRPRLRFDVSGSTRQTHRGFHDQRIELPVN